MFPAVPFNFISYPLVRCYCYKSPLCLLIDEKNKHGPSIEKKQLFITRSSSMDELMVHPLFLHPFMTGWWFPHPLLNTIKHYYEPL